MRKDKKKENEKKKMPQASADMEWQRRNEWLGWIGFTRSIDSTGNERVNLSFLSLSLSNQDNSKQKAAAPAGEYQENAKKFPQIIDLESKLNK